MTAFDFAEDRIPMADRLMGLLAAGVTVETLVAMSIQGLREHFRSQDRLLIVRKAPSGRVIAKSYDPLGFLLAAQHMGWVPYLEDGGVVWPAASYWTTPDGAASYYCDHGCADDDGVPLSFSAARRDRIRRAAEREVARIRRSVERAERVRQAERRLHLQELAKGAVHAFASAIRRQAEEQGRPIMEATAIKRAREICNEPRSRAAGWDAGTNH